MKMKVALIVLGVGVLFSLTGCHKHQFADATCTEPKTCTECGETEGEPLGHTWEEATCIIAKTCSRCGETEGEALGHAPGEWEITREATLSNPGEQQRKCTRCSELVDSESIYKEIEYGNGQFNFTGKEFADYLQSKLNSNYTILTSTEHSVGLLKVYGIYEGSEAYLYYGFKPNENGMVEKLAVGGWEGTDKNDVIAFGGFMADKIDPSIDDKTFFTNIALTKYYSHGGLEYVYGNLENNGDYPLFFIQFEE